MEHDERVDNPMEDIRKQLWKTKIIRRLRMWLPLLQLQSISLIAHASKVAIFETGPPKRKHIHVLVNAQNTSIGCVAHLPIISRGLSPLFEGLVFRQSFVLYV